MDTCTVDTEKILICRTSGIKCVFIHPTEHILSIDYKPYIVLNHVSDREYNNYEIAHFLTCCMKASPHTLDILFSGDVLHKSETGSMLLSMRRSIVNQDEAIKTFSNKSLSMIKKHISMDASGVFYNSMLIAFNLLDLLKSGEYSLDKIGYQKDILDGIKCGNISLNEAEGLIKNTIKECENIGVRHNMFDRSKINRFLCDVRKERVYE